jgi:nucleoside-diphosphate-sugar epimerase
VNALIGVERAFLLSADDPRQVELQGNLVEAAQQAGVRHIVKLSAYTAAPDSPVSFARWHWQTEEQLKQSGLAYTILRPTLTYKKQDRICCSLMVMVFGIRAWDESAWANLIQSSNSRSIVKVDACMVLAWT